MDLQRAALLIVLGSVGPLLYAPEVLSAPAISTVTGTVQHGQSITVSGSGFGTKSNPDQTVTAAPILWDVVSAQWRGGVNVDAYNGLSDGDEITDSIWQNRGEDAWGGERTEYATSRTFRHSRVTAQYNANGPKCMVGTPRYINGETSFPGSHKTFYLSFYRRLKIGANVQPGGGDGSTKIVRFEWSPEKGGGNWLGGSDFLAQLGWGGDCGIPIPSDKYKWIVPGTETTYVRWEVYLNAWYGGAGKGWLDVYKNGHYHTAGDDPKELRPYADWQWFTGDSDEYAYNAHGLDANTAVVAGTIGYDDGHDMSTGQEIDLSEIYYDNTQARVEVSDQATWDQSPTATATREVQGRLLTWSDTQITLLLYQGAFASFAGKYLYVIDADGNVNASGYLLEDVGPGTGSKNWWIGR